MRSETESISISLTINGAPTVVEVAPGDRLLDTLRYTLGLTGTKEGCGEGECGACAVLLDGAPANSCLVLAVQARGMRVETIEGVDPASLGPFHESGLAQCGACTPGVVLTACWIRENPGLLDAHSLRELMAGNLCRCTGYDGIIEGIEEALKQDEDAT